MNLDAAIVASYLVLILVAGYLVSRRHRAGTAVEFATGGRTRTWYQSGLAMLSMAVDPGYMSIAGLGFAFGLYLTQWTGVHVWFTTWFAAMFFLPIYWRSRIVTTPEYLEKRFNVQCRVAFSLLMVVLLVMTLALGLYLGALLLQALIQPGALGPEGTGGLDPRFALPSVAIIAVVTASYVILGGMRTVLTLATYQAMFLVVTLLLVAGMAVYQVGGPAGLAQIPTPGDAGVPLPSIVPPSTWDLTTGTFFPAQAILLWATVVGLSWLACNFGMAQRLLAARSERDAQKSLLLLGALVAVVPTCAFIVGAAVRQLRPDLLPDSAFLYVMLEMFPAGIRGVLAAGMMAALLSTADGLLTSSGTLLTQDVYLRFVSPNASDRQRKAFIRTMQVTALIVAILLVPLLMRSRTAMEFVQAFYAVLFGVIVGLYVAGVFSTRAAPRSAFFAIVSGLAVAIVLRYTGLNFAYVGFFSFLYTLLACLLVSRLERPVPRERLINLTIFTLEDVKGPWVGLKAWPNLWKWALLLAGVWFALSAWWEWTVRA